LLGLKIEQSMALVMQHIASWGNELTRDLVWQRDNHPFERRRVRGVKNHGISPEPKKRDNCVFLSVHRCNMKRSLQFFIPNIAKQQLS
jgi:hypothetical protein